MLKGDGSETKVLSMLGIYPRRGIKIVKHEKHVLTYKYTDIFKNGIDCILDFALILAY
jgi:hypothetical protein